MTIEEAIKELKLEWDIFMEGARLRGREKEEAERNPDFKQVYEANMMAIASLEAWEAVRQEVKGLFRKPPRFTPNYDEYSMFLKIIDKHLQMEDE